MKFVKAHACGNDFLVVEGACDPQLAVALCRRNTGVGADGVEFLERTGARAGRIRLANADGSLAEISGNGTRCVAAWLAEHSGAQAGDLIALETDAGPRECRVIEAAGHRFQIASPMGVPQVKAATVRLQNGTEVEGHVVNVGNPHFVIQVQDGDFTVQGRDWRDLGKAICFHPDFSAQTNVEFVRATGTNTVEIRIFERGVGPTTSSGTGTCASAVTGVFAGWVQSPVRVKSEGGEQRVEWGGAGEEIRLTGPAELICEGEAFVG